MPGQPWLAYQNPQPQAQAGGKPWEKYAQPERPALEKSDRLDAKPMTWKETADDYANAIGSNVAKAAIAIPGLPGDVINLGSKAAAGWAGILGYSPEQAYALERKLTEHAPPTTEELTPVGLNYDPKTEGARIVGNAAGIGTAALTGPASLGRKAVQTAAITAASELGGPYGGLIAAVATGGKGGRLGGKTTADLKAIRDRAYDIARKDGTAVTRDQYDAIVNKVVDAVVAKGADVDLTPKAIKVNEKLARRDGPMTLDELDKARQIFGLTGGDAAASERILSKVGREAFDAGIDEAQVPNRTWKEARQAHRDFKNSELVDNLNHKIDLKASQYTQSGKENATRAVYRQLAGNESKMRRFDPATRAAIDKVAMGGAVENAARWGGKFAPTGVVSAMPTLGAILSGRWDLAAALLGPGVASRMAANYLTGRNRRIAEELIKKGGKEGLIAFKNAEDKRRLDAMVQALVGGNAALLPDRAGHSRSLEIDFPY